MHKNPAQKKFVKLRAMFQESENGSIIPVARFWPEHVRQRVNSTYIYFAGGLGVTSVAAFAATRAVSVMRLMAGRPVAVSSHPMSLST